MASITAIFPPVVERLSARNYRLPMATNSPTAPSTFAYRSHTFIGFRHSTDKRNPLHATGRNTTHRTHAGSLVKIETGMDSMPAQQRLLKETDHASTNEQPSNNAS